MSSPFMFGIIFSFLSAFHSLLSHVCWKWRAKCCLSSYSIKNVCILLNKSFQSNAKGGGKDSLSQKGSQFNKRYESNTNSHWNRCSARKNRAVALSLLSTRRPFVKRCLIAQLSVLQIGAPDLTWNSFQSLVAISLWQDHHGCLAFVGCGWSLCGTSPFQISIPFPPKVLIEQCWWVGTHLVGHNNGASRKAGSFHDGGCRP